MKWFLTSQKWNQLYTRNPVSVHSAESLSYLLRTAQHVSLRPGDALLQDPALLLNTQHTQKNQTTVEMWVVESCAGACMPWNTWITAWFPIIFMIFKADIQQQITRLFISTFQLLRSETSLPQLRCLHSRREPVRWLPDRGSRWTPRTPAAKGSHVEWWWLHIVRQILNSAFHCVSTPAFFDFSNVM